MHSQKCLRGSSEFRKNGGEGQEVLKNSSDLTHLQTAGLQIRFSLRESNSIKPSQFVYNSMEEIDSHLTECYENRSENRFSDSRRICRPGLLGGNLSIFLILPLPPFFFFFQIGSFFWRGGDFFIYICLQTHCDSYFHTSKLRLLAANVEIENTLFNTANVISTQQSSG